jgi:putative transposase
MFWRRQRSPTGRAQHLIGCSPNQLTGIVRLIGQLVRHTARRRTVSLYHRHRFPGEIFGHCVWLYFRFALSFRDVEEMLAMRGVVLTYETVREWCLKFGQTYANNLRRRSVRPGDRWHLDEVFLKINGRLHYLWRAVDQDGAVLDILVQRKRDKRAAKKFFRTLLKRLRYVPR